MYRCGLGRWLGTRFAGRRLPRQGGSGRLDAPIRRQLLDLLLLCRGQRHDRLGGQAGAGDAALHRLGRQRRGLGNLGLQGRHILRGMDNVGFVQVGLGQPDILYRFGLRQTAALHQGRRRDPPDMRVPGEHLARRPDIIDPGDVSGVVDDGPVDDGLVDVGHPGDVTHRRAPAIGADESRGEEACRVISRHHIGGDKNGLVEKRRDVGRGHEDRRRLGIIGITRGVRLPETQQKAGRPDEDPQGGGERIRHGSSRIIRSRGVARRRHVVGRRDGGPAYVRRIHRGGLGTGAPIHGGGVPGAARHPYPAVAGGGHPVAVMVSGPAPGLLGLKDVAVIGGRPAPVGIRPPIFRDIIGVPNRAIAFVIHPLPVLGQVVVKHGHVFRSRPGRPGKGAAQDDSQPQGQDGDDPWRSKSCFHFLAPLRWLGI